MKNRAAAKEREAYMKILRSSEDYLEAMLVLKQNKGYIRSADVADLLNVSRPSVSAAVKKLRENGYLTMDEASMITLTESGRSIAERIYERHRVLTTIFRGIGVDPVTARTDACKVEHDISDRTFRALCDYAKQFPADEGSLEDVQAVVQDRN